MSLLEQASHVSKHLLSKGFTDDAVAYALRTIGEALAVDRAYIFENSRDARSGELLMSQRYEWSVDAVTPQIDNPELQNLAYETGCPGWAEVLRRGEVIQGSPRTMHPTTRELLESQQIQSILVCPINVGGEWWGFVGFDDCRKPRPWPPDEVAVLSALARALAGSLRHGKVRSSLTEARKALRDVINRPPR